MRRWTAVIVLLLAFGASPTTARANDEERISRSNAMWKEGMARYNIQKYDEAIDYFKKAYEIFPNGDILYNIAQAYRMKKEYETAIFYFRAFLREKPNTPKREKVEAIIVELENLDAAQKASEEKPPQGVEPPDDDGQAHNEDAHPDLTPDVTPRRTIAQVDDAQGQGEHAGGAVVPVVDVGGHARPWYADRWGWTVTGVGAIALGVGVGYLVTAEQTRNEIAGAATAFDREQLRQEADRQEGIGVPVAIGGGAVLAVGVGLLIWNPGDKSARPIAGVGQGVAWVGVQGAF